MFWADSGQIRSKGIRKGLGIFFQGKGVHPITGLQVEGFMGVFFATMI